MRVFDEDTHEEDGESGEELRSRSSILDDGFVLLITPINRQGRHFHHLGPLLICLDTYCTPCMVPASHQAKLTAADTEIYRDWSDATQLLQRPPSNRQSSCSTPWGSLSLRFVCQDSHKEKYLPDFMTCLSTIVTPKSLSC